MKKTIATLPLLLTAAASQAGVIADLGAYDACQQRFKSANQGDALQLRPGPVYSKQAAHGEYTYYFNARSERGDYRVACRSKRLGKVVDFSIEPGRWVYNSGSQR